MRGRFSLCETGYDDGCVVPTLFAALTGWGYAPAAPGYGICDASSVRYTGCDLGVVPQVAVYDSNLFVHGFGCHILLSQLINAIDIRKGRIRNDTAFALQDGLEPTTP